MWFCLIVGNCRVSYCCSVYCRYIKKNGSSCINSAVCANNMGNSTGQLRLSENLWFGFALTRATNIISHNSSSYSFKIDFGTLHGISQVFFVSGIPCKFILHWSGRRICCMRLLCCRRLSNRDTSLHYLGANAHDVSSGLYAFSAVLTSLSWHRI